MIRRWGIVFVTMNALEELHVESKRRAHAHLKMATKLVKFHYSLGVPLVIATALLGMDELQDFVSTPAWVKAALSVFAVALASSQTFLSFQERGESHRSVGSGWQAIRHEIQLELEAGSASDQQQNLFQQAATLRSASPAVKQSVWDEVKNLYPN